jgi:hypothetical protein
MGGCVGDYLLSGSVGETQRAGLDSLDLSGRDGFIRKMFGLFKKMDPDRFAKIVLDEIKKAGGPRDYVFVSDTMMLKRDEDLINLRNVYQQYCREKDDARERILRNFVEVVISRKSSNIPSLDEARDKLVAVTRERAMFSQADAIWSIEYDRIPEGRMVYDPLTKWFARTVVLDFPGHMTVVSKSQMKEWAIAFDEVFEIGIENLKRASAPKFRRDGAFFSGLWKDDYDSSRLLLPELFGGLGLNGDPVIVLPNRLTLLVCGSKDESGIQAMLTKAEEIMRTEAKPQNPSPLVIQGGKIHDFEVPRSSTIFPCVQRAQRLAAMEYCNDQKAQLDKLYTQKGKDLFVASYKLNLEKNGEYTAFSVWSKGVPSLLPETDVVFFFDPDLPKDQQIVARAPWARVASVAGDFMLDTNMFPARHYVSKFPSAEQIALMTQAPAA